MKKCTPLLLLLVSMLLLNACKKETVKTKKELLTQKTWVIQKFEEKAGTANWVDDFPNFDACSKDDQYVFRANNTYEFNEGATKCAPTDPQIFDTGAWAFLDNETKLRIGSEDFNIEKLDNTSLVLTVQETIQSTVYQLRITFRHL